MGATQSGLNTHSCSTSMRCLPSLSTWRSRKGYNIRCQSIAVIDTQQPLRLHGPLASPSELSTCNKEDGTLLPQTSVMQGLQTDSLMHLFEESRTRVCDSSSAQPKVSGVEVLTVNKVKRSEDGRHCRDGPDSKSRPRLPQELVADDPVTLVLSSETVSSSLDGTSGAGSPKLSVLSQAANTSSEGGSCLRMASEPVEAKMSDQALDDDLSDFYIAAPPIQPSIPEKSARSARELSRQAGAPYMLVLAVASIVKDELLGKWASSHKRPAEGELSDKLTRNHKRHRSGPCTKDQNIDAQTSSESLPSPPGKAIILVQSPRYTAHAFTQLFSGDFPPLPKLGPNILLDSGAWSDFGGLLLENGCPQSPSTSSVLDDDARFLESQPLPAICEAQNPGSREDEVASASSCEPTLSPTLNDLCVEKEPSSIAPLAPKHDTPIAALLPASPLPAGAAALLLQPTNIPRQSQSPRKTKCTVARQASKIPAPRTKRVQEPQKTKASGGRRVHNATTVTRAKTPSSMPQRKHPEPVTPAPQKSRRVMPSWKVSLTTDSSSSSWKVVSASTADSRSSRSSNASPLRSSINEIRSMRRELQSCWHLSNLDLTALASEVDSLMNIIQRDSPPALKMEAAGLQAEFDAIVHGMQERSDELALNRALRSFALNT